MTCKGLTIDASISPHKSMIENLNEILSQTLPSCDAQLKDAEHFCFVGNQSLIEPKAFREVPKAQQHVAPSTTWFPYIFWSPLSSFSGLYYPFQNKEWANVFSQVHPNSEIRNARDLTQTPSQGNGHIQGGLSHQLHFQGLKRSVFEILSIYALFFPPVF